MLPIFTGDFSFTAHLWDKEENWTVVPVPEHLACRNVAQAIREEANARSAQVFTLNEHGERVTWGFYVAYKNGGSSSYHEFSPKDGTRAWNRIINDNDVREARLQRWEGGQVTTRLEFQAEGK
jgi:hypothetical protein